MRADPRLGRVTLGNSVLGTVQLLEEVAVSQYALHAGLHLQHIKSVWRDLWGHVATQLQTGKGVLLPGIGSIVLQSGGVCTQQRLFPVLHLANSLGGRLESPNLANIAYEQVAHRSRLHPSICRRIVQEALLLLSQHIAAPTGLQVELPGVGWLHSEARGAARLELDQLLLQHLSLQTPLTRPPSAQVLTVHNSPRGLSRPYTAAAQPQVAHMPAAPQANSLEVLTVHAGLDSLAQVCIAADTLRTGYVTRLMLEEGLRQHCRHALQSLPAPALLDLMDAHAAGHSDKFVRFRSFLSALDLLLSDQRGFENNPAAGINTAGPDVSLPRPAACPEVIQAQPALPVAPVKQVAMPVPPAAAVPFAPRPLDVSRPGSAHDHASYYLQGRQRHMSRAECDAFNHMHFARLQSAHGKRGVTPKVQQEILTQEEVALLHPMSAVHICLDPPQQAPQVLATATRPYSPRRPASPASKWQCKSSSLEPQLQIEKQRNAQNLQEGWQQQMHDKDRALHEYNEAEKQWPYSPPRQAHMRVAISPPKHAGLPSAAAWDMPAVHHRTHGIA